MSETSDQSTRIIAFYGYKGGAGRSLLAANLAVALHVCNKKVLLIDWDLEAPGIGDFLDSIGIAGEGRVSELWHQKDGILDLIGEWDKTPTGEGGNKITEFLSKNVVPVAVRTFPGELSFLGPGRSSKGDYPATLMTRDWLRIVRDFSDEFAESFRESCASYNSVIIDTRTGLNLTTAYVLRFLTDQVFLVSPKTHQALEGTRRMWELLQDPRGPGVTPDQHLVLARHEDDATLGSEVRNTSGTHSVTDQETMMFWSFLTLVTSDLSSDYCSTFWSDT